MFRRPSRIAVPLLVCAGLALLAVPASGQKHPAPRPDSWWFPMKPQSPPPLVRYSRYLNGR